MCACVYGTPCEIKSISFCSEAGLSRLDCVGERWLTPLPPHTCVYSNAARRKAVCEKWLTLRHDFSTRIYFSVGCFSDPRRTTDPSTGRRGAHGRLTYVWRRFHSEHARSSGPNASFIAAYVSFAPVITASSVIDRTLSARITHGCFSTTLVLPPPASSITHTGYTSCGTHDGHASRPSFA